MKHKHIFVLDTEILSNNMRTIFIKCIECDLLLSDSMILRFIENLTIQNELLQKRIDDMEQDAYDDMVERSLND